MISLFAVLNQTKMELYLEGPDGGIDFQADTLNVTEIPTDLSWKTAALERIEDIRKGDLTVKVKSAKSKNYRVKVYLSLLYLFVHSIFTLIHLFLCSAFSCLFFERVGRLTRRWSMGDLSAEM